jgi:hypothetical protein
MSLVGAVDEVDHQLDKIQKRIEKYSEKDPDLSVVADILGPLQRKVSQAQAACEDLDYFAREVVRVRGR